jgi:hypothetical protein
MVDQHL